MPFCISPSTSSATGHSRSIPTRPSNYIRLTVSGMDHGEAMALAWALLPNKTKASYVELFTATRDAFVTEFGDVACDHPFARPN